MTAADADIHIAGVLVQCRPLQLLPVQRAIGAVAGAEVERTSVDGKLVVIVEGGSSKAVLDAVDAMRALPGVLDVALVYQHAEPADAMAEELDEEMDP